jgi:hypothetical protein
MIAQFIWDEPQRGKDFAAEINIYLHNGDVIQILFGNLDEESVQDLAETYCLIAPHVIAHIAYTIEATRSIYLITGATAHC